MTCPNCNEIMVKARASNFGEDYDYCRTCKKELAEMQPCGKELSEMTPNGGLIKNTGGSTITLPHGYTRYRVSGGSGAASFAMPEPTLHSSAYCNSRSGGEHYRHMIEDECKCQRIYYDPVLNVWCDRGPHRPSQAAKPTGQSSCPICGDPWHLAPACPNRVQSSPSPPPSTLLQVGDRGTWLGHRGTVSRVHVDRYRRRRLSIIWEDPGAVQKEYERICRRPTALMPKFMADGQPLYPNAQPHPFEPGSRP